MIDLYFNDCLPTSFDSNKFSVLGSLHNIKSLLTKQGISVSSGIILSDTPSKVIVNGVSLVEHIKNLPKEDKTYFEALFYMRQPISELIDNYSSEDAIKYLYDCKFNGRNANDLAAAGIMGCLALSIPVEDELSSDSLTVDIINPDTKRKGSPVIVDNYYGGNIGTTLNKLIPKDKSLQEKLIRDFNVLGKNCYVTPEFETIWKGLNGVLQEGIISRFEDARNANLMFPPKEDNNIVKEDYEGTGVFELREKGHKLRIYFKSGKQSIVIGWYGTKTQFYGADQSSDFKHANQVIDEYIAKHNIML